MYCAWREHWERQRKSLWLYEDRKDDTSFSHWEKHSCHSCHLIFMFRGRLADLKESFKNKETRWIKWDPNINAKQKSTLPLLNNQDPPYWPLRNCKKFYIGYTCLLHGPSNFQQMVSGISLFKNTNVSRYL